MSRKTRRKPVTLTAGSRVLIERGSVPAAEPLLRLAVLRIALLRIGPPFPHRLIRVRLARIRRFLERGKGGTTGR